jgi:iron-sulfur cluster assembly protein
MSVIESDAIVTGSIDTTPLLMVTDAAANTIQTLLEQRQIPNHVLRVFVSGGGCSGMQYGMAFETAPQEFDRVVSVGGGIRLVVDPTSMMYLEGATIDFVDSLVGGGFRIDNPNAGSSCGCGKSFRSKNETAENTATDGCGSCSSY